MPVQRPLVAEKVRLRTAVRSQLESVARSTSAEHRLVLRARIVLRAADGQTNAAIARAVGVTEDSVRKWRGRFAANPVLDSRFDLPRSGRPAVVPLIVRLQVIKLACSRPKGNHAPFHDVWTLDALVNALRKTTGYKLSRSEVGRTLRSEELRPHMVRLWLHSADPQFRRKVKVICELYTRPPPGSHVVCVDEKTSIQALERIHPGRLPTLGRPGRAEFEYRRHSVQALIAGFDVKTGKVFGVCRKRRTAADLAEFMEVLASRYPTGDVYVVWDNLNIHDERNWNAFNRRHGNRFHFVYTPKHASWVNQVEIWFSILQRRVLRFGNFHNVAELAKAILGFIAHWNRYEAHPFRWTFRGRFRQNQRPMAA